MKRILNPRASLPFLAGFSGLALQSFLFVAGSSPIIVEAAEPRPLITETEKDLPASFHRFFGQRINSWKDSERQIAKVDLDTDLNQDGVVSDKDPADSGAFEATPPGQLLGEGELTRFVLRLLPYRVDFDGEVVVTLEVEGINRSSATGEFETFDQEVAETGRIRVWKNFDKKVLLLDSADPKKRVVEFTTRYKTYPYNLPIAVPRFFFVEGVKTSPRYTGDLRILATVSHRALSPEKQEFSTAAKNVATAQETLPQSASDKVGIKSFRTTFDHVLVTVQPEPLPKEFINGNNEGAWIAPPGYQYKLPVVE